MKKLFILLLVFLCGCSFKFQESIISNDTFYNAYTENYSTKEEVLNEMEKIVEREYNRANSDLEITTEYITNITEGKRETFFWKDLDPNSRYLTSVKDRTSTIMRIRFGKMVVYGLAIAKRSKVKKEEHAFAILFPQKEDAQTMQALCFRMAELQ